MYVQLSTSYTYYLKTSNILEMTKYGYKCLMTDTVFTIITDEVTSHMYVQSHTNNGNYHHTGT